MKELHNSQYQLRRILGFLAISLPIFLVVVHGRLLSTMSHYYYTPSCIFFIIILSAFGFVLLSYKGYPRDQSKKEYLSDNLITTLAGISILVTVLIPTDINGSIGNIIPTNFKNQTYLFGYQGNNTLSIIHAVSAGFFLSFIGVMCYSKFTLGPNLSKGKSLFYKICGLTIWIALTLFILLYAIDRSFLNKNLDSYFPGYRFWCETLALVAFSAAWFVKGKFDKKLLQSRLNIFYKKTA